MINMCNPGESLLTHRQQNEEYDRVDKGCRVELKLGTRGTTTHNGQDTDDAKKPIDGCDIAIENTLIKSQDYMNI